MDWKLPALGMLVGVALDFVLPFWGIPVFAAALAYWIIGASVEGVRPRPAAAPESLWGLPGLAVVSAVCLIHYWLITRGSGHPLGEELLGTAFDSLAAGLARGTAQVDPLAIRWEGMLVEGRTYMYFGPWPALLRMPLNALAPAYAGQWSPATCFLARLEARVDFVFIQDRLSMFLRYLDDDRTSNLAFAEFESGGAQLGLRFGWLAP